MRINKRILLAAAVPALASAWVPSASFSSSALTTRNNMRVTAQQLRSTLENATKEKVAAATSSSSPDETTTTVLKPEYEGALTLIRDTLKASIPQDKHDKMLPLISHFAQEYVTACQTSLDVVKTDANAQLCAPHAVVQRFLSGIQFAMMWGMERKFPFSPLHKACRGLDPENEMGNTVDLYEYGSDFFRPCIHSDKSVLLGRDNVDQLMKQVQQGHNVVLFANHQSEADPQVLSCLMEDKTPYGDDFFDLIFVAGHKVTTDPLAVPFSMGRNLICIHSKKHIDTDPETKPAKQKQNLRAMSAMLDRFKQGGTLLWVAPSGGRDRRNVDTGDVPLAPFDSKTIDMFRLIGNKSKVPTHYYTMAMVSYDLCPPPDFVEAGVGEARNVRFVPCGIAVGDECVSEGGLEKRHDFCNHAFEQCQEDYQKLQKLL